jgi:hypothetical protein
MVNFGTIYLGDGELNFFETLSYREARSSLFYRIFVEFFSVCGVR